LLFERVEPADTRGENGSEAVFGGGNGTGLFEGFGGCGQGELLHSVRTTSFLRIVEVGRCIPIDDFIRLGVDDGRPEKPSPEILFADSTWRHHTQTSDGDAVRTAVGEGIAHQSLEVTRSKAWPTV